MAKAASADHGNGQATRSNNGSKDERSLVADAAGGVLVDLSAGKAREVEHFAGMEHRLGESGELGTIEAANPRGHEPGGHLVIGDFAARVTGDEEIDLLAGVFAGIAFFADEVDGAHAVSSTAARA